MNCRAMIVICLLVIGGMIAACDSSTPPPQDAKATPAATAATTQSAAATPPAATTATDAQPTYANLSDMLIQAGPNVQIIHTTDFTSQFANEARYREMFGTTHIHMMLQHIKIGSNEGAITFVEFANEADAAKAAQLVSQRQAKRPCTGLAYGKFVAIIQLSTGDNAQFVQDVRNTLDKR